MPPAVAILDQTAAPPAGFVVVGGRPEDVVVFERAVVDFFVDAAGLLGVPKSVAAIYGLFFASPQPLCFADVEARLDLSKGSVSQGLRVLREVGALKLAPANGERREFLVPDLELRRLIQHWLEQRLRKQLESGRTRLAGLSQAIPTGSPAETREMRGRLKQLQGWHDKARALLPVAKTFLNLTTRSP